MARGAAHEQTRAPRLSDILHDPETSAELPSRCLSFAKVALGAPRFSIRCSTGPFLNRAKPFTACRAAPPHEGSPTLAYGIYHIENLAAYEACRARLADVPQGRENYLFAQSQKFILKEDRTWLTNMSAPQGGST